jgi:chromosome segregation ATPase
VSEAEAPATRNVELRRRIGEAWEQTAKLEADTSALLGVCVGLRGDERELQDERDRVEKDCAELTRRLAAIDERCQELDQQALAMRDEVALRELQTRSARRDHERLAQQAAKLSEELEGCRRDVSDAKAAVQTVAGSVLRMDYKLRRGQAHEEGA